MNLTSKNNFPKLHNAAWPGVVGKGPGAEPPIDLDTMLDLTAAAEVDGVKFDGVDLFLFAPHVNIDATDDDLKSAGRQGRGAGLRRRLGRRAGLAADRRRLGDGRRRRSGRSSSTQVRKGCRIAQQAARAGRPALRRRPDRLGGRRRATGPADPEAEPGRSPRPSGRPATIAEDHGERLAAEGEICWGGMHSWRTMVEPARDGRAARDGRLPGRHGPHAALHARRQRAGGPHPARGLRLEGPKRRSTRRCKTLTARAAALDDRLPRRPERRHGPRLRLARQDRPALPADRPQRQARHRHSTPASGCATSRAS